MSGNSATNNENPSSRLALKTAIVEKNKLRISMCLTNSDGLEAIAVC
jgi:hypothetical protein